MSTYKQQQRRAIGFAIFVSVAVWSGAIGLIAYVVLG